MTADNRTNEELLAAARTSDEGALAVLVVRHRDRLERMVRLRTDRLQGRAAQVLVIKPSAAANRYVRALERLEDVFQGMPGGIEGARG